MEDDKRVNYKLDAISKLISNLKLSISGNKEHDELGENNVIVNSVIYKRDINSLIFSTGTRTFQ